MAYDIETLLKLLKGASGQENAQANILADSIRQTPIPPTSPLKRRTQPFKPTPSRVAQLYQDSEHYLSEPQYVDEDNPLDTPENFSIDPGMDEMLAQIGFTFKNRPSGQFAEPFTRPRGTKGNTPGWEGQAKVPLDSPYWPRIR